MRVVTPSIPHTSSKNSQHGFTLVELAIVLVVIGLVVGGTLLGRSLIKSAEISGAIADIQKLKTAYSHFQGKYKCVAGDCLRQTNFFNFTGVANGNGNRLIECATTDGPDCSGAISEYVMAFKVLHAAGFIRASGQTVDDFEPTKLRECQLSLLRQTATATAAFLYNAPSSNYMLVNQPITSAPWHRDCMTPYEAESIDLKLDDGLAGTGKVLGVSRYGASNLNCATVPNDQGEKVYAAYNQAQYGVDCTLYIRMGK